MHCAIDVYASSSAKAPTSAESRMLAHPMMPAMSGFGESTMTTVTAKTAMSMSSTVSCARKLKLSTNILLSILKCSKTRQVTRSSLSAETIRDAIMSQESLTCIPTPEKSKSTSFVTRCLARAAANRRPFMTKSPQKGNNCPLGEPFTAIPIELSSTRSMLNRDLNATLTRPIFRFDIPACSGGNANIPPRKGTTAP